MRHNILFFLLLVFLFGSCGKNKTPSTVISSPSGVEVTQLSKGGIQDLNVPQSMAIQGAIYLDVRTQEEVDGGAIPNSVHIDFRKDNFEEEVLKLDKTKAYVVYCRSGARSSKASKMMVDLGFGKVANMAGGYNEYKVVME